MKTWQLLKQNPELFNRYFVKEYMIKAVRRFFEEREYHELESPILAFALPQERYLDVLSTSIEFQNGDKKEAYIIPSTETYNKKILVAGLGNHFVITKVSRGLEEISPNHSPEFTMLEWYELGHNYNDLMNSTEELVINIKKFLDKKFNREENLTINYQGQDINFGSPWYRFSVKELFAKHLNVNLDEYLEREPMIELARSLDFNLTSEDDWQTAFDMIFSAKIEPNFPQDKPVFVYDYPKAMCPLTKESENPNYCQKVEFYIAGKEIGNGYTELTDWKEQEKRFIIEQKVRKELGRKEIAFDHDLVEALKSGMPEVAGIGVGLDRLAMILADAKTISEINYFPAAEEI